MKPTRKTSSQREIKNVIISTLSKKFYGHEIPQTSSHFSYLLIFRTYLLTYFSIYWKLIKIKFTCCCVFAKNHFVGSNDLEVHFIIFIRLWHWKRRLSWPDGQWKSEGMLGRILKVEKTVRKSVVKIEKKNLTWAPVIVWKRKNPSPFRSSVECSSKMEMKYSDKGTLVQRQRYPLPSRSPQYWPMNHCVRNTTSRRSVFENIFDNCFVIIGNGEFNHYHFNNWTLTLKNLNNI